jgi:cardiolipin synthase A/B
VRVLVPAESNHVLADWLARHYFEFCLRNGIRIFLYQGGMIHAKTATIDGIWSTVGTANLDRLSLAGNHEINLEIYNADFARSMEEIFRCDLTNARELNLADWIKRPWYIKAAELVLSPLWPML